MSNNAVINVKSKLSSKNQITLPKTIREFLNVNSTDEINFAIDPDTHQVTVTAQKPSFWDTVHQQETKYGNLSTPEVDWGKDIESDDF